MIIKKYYIYPTENGGLTLLTSKLLGVNELGTKTLITAEDDLHTLTKDNKMFYESKWVLEDELSQWKEVLKGNNL